MSDTKPVFRFAPSPNGYLHLGHALSALVTADMAERYNGRFLLRLEDIDIDRCRPDYERQILDDLAWLGLNWEEPVRRQSDHLDSYAQGLHALRKLGVLYPCCATRREISEAAKSSGVLPYPTDPDGAPLYPGRHKVLPRDIEETRRHQGDKFALRLDMERALAVARDIDGNLSFRSLNEQGDISIVEAFPERWGDALVARKDVQTSYHLSVVMDDALQWVTHVTRGEDLLAATDLHRLLQVLLRLPAPIYHHHRLVLDDSGRKLSKSHADKSLKSLREDGASPEDIRRLVGF